MTLESIKALVSVASMITDGPTALGFLLSSLAALAAEEGIPEQEVVQAVRQAFLDNKMVQR